MPGGIQSDAIGCRHNLLFFMKTVSPNFLSAAKNILM